ncbi:uncharacterized protein CcaverHIS019_0401350 [Cutaneotrichosporon cavernicola]|uniref:RmlD-like substrate binding domain-containing protein n=1 Tax=Cutaneotrichosporon cavernicola TaxID=279322 RepID=A0AA48L3K8_9TREE|nr:uncharacterized protein CcaverHIS019_0401350 [Cutaneotrichosporon cavernicola]BEI91315.1 hypothetical protein CcaverHIS019_0401350 [Cutaneotrichosporon cavernicola]
MSESRRVVVTGASGLLGRAVVEAFRARGDDVTALAHTRVRDGFTPLDLTDTKAVEAFFERPVDVVVHCAAERRPDVAEANPAAAEAINVAVPAVLASLAAKHGFTLLYLSTDYVFDGRKPPYDADSETHPLQMYGRQKLAGEQAIRVAGARACALRVPVLYGRTEFNAESAVNVLVDVVKDQSGKKYTMDDYQIRNPTCVEDVARVLFDLSRTPNLPPIAQYRSTGKPYTKWDMTKVIAAALNLPLDHITPFSTKPTNGTERPWNTELSIKSLEEAGISTAEAKTFEAWWTEYLQ